MNLDAFRPTPAGARDAIVEEANRVAPVRDAASASVKFSR